MAFVPLAGLAALVLTGAAAGLPALLAMAAVLLAALALAVLWARDVELLAETLRQASHENLPGVARAAAAPALPAMARLARTMERLARAQASRATRLGEGLRASEAIIERLPDPLLVLGPDRAVLRANAAARAAFGADIAAVLRHPDLRAAIEAAWRHRGSEVAEIDLPVPVARAVQAMAIYLDPALADGGQALLVLSDRTRERAVERMRADFVANASHELRTPLASLIGFIATLRGPAADDPPAQQRFLAIMDEQAERMNRLIDDLLSLSRIELVEHQAPSEPVDVAALAERIAAGFEPRIAARRQRLELAIAGDLGTIPADADQLAQVLGNLLDNAIKYGRDEGVVRLSVAAAAGGRWPARPGVTLAVTDDGPGIPRAHVPRLTERFYRVDQGRSRAAGGTGLGLAIVKHIVNHHRGQLAIDSDAGSGASFTVWLPATADK
ncbi:MAG: two-component sensor histidine kinase [Rhodospirillales bacterium]|nr:two-component sensor histidine kinase [Rhodospirillales bacterium]